MVTPVRIRVSTLVIVGALCALLAPACDPQASKDASLSCKNDVECSTGLACLPARHGLTGECIQPACSRRCTTDVDCKGMRTSSDNKECFVCKDVSACPVANAQSSDGGLIQVCVDRCEFVPAAN